jgi:hypothetical protein
VKNPFLLFAVWLLLFSAEIFFPWRMGETSLRPYGSYFVLGYVFFTLPPLSALLFAAGAFLFQSSYTTSHWGPFIFVFSLYLWVEGLKRKTFSENIAARGFAVFLSVFLNIWLLEELSGFGLFRGPENFSLHFFLSVRTLFEGLFLLGNLFLSVLIFWILEEKGILWEETLLAFRARKGQLNLFEARHLRKMRKKGMRTQKRIRRRFGLQDSW